MTTRHSQITSRRSCRNAGLFVARASCPRFRRNAGLSLVEILIALAITALLITATAVAFDAAFRSYETNHDLAMAGMSARNSLYQMTALIRSAWNDPDIAAIDVNADGSELSFTDANGRNLIYRYNPTAHALELNIDGAATWYSLVENVAPLAADQPVFNIALAGPDYPAGTVGTVYVQCKTTSGSVTKPICSAVVPRNILYSE